MTCKHTKQQGELTWLDWRAERQQITMRGSKQVASLAELEASLVGEFARSVEAELRTMDEAAARAYANAIRTGDQDAMRALEAAQRATTGISREVAERIAASAREYTQLIVEAGFQAGANSIDLPELALTSEPSQSVIDATNRTATRMAQSVTRTQAARIQTTIRAGIEENLTTSEVQRLLRERGLDATRAQAIARTETARAYSDGQIASWEDSTIVQGKVWLVSPFACEFCEAAASEFATKQVGLRDNFYTVGQTITGIDGGTMTIGFDDVSGPPLHPNCRCSIDAALEPLPEIEGPGAFEVTVT